MEAFILARVVDDEVALFMESMGAEGQVTPRFTCIDTAVGLEPLAILVHQ